MNEERQTDWHCHMSVGFITTELQNYDGRSEVIAYLIDTRKGYPRKYFYKILSIGYDTVNGQRVVSLELTEDGQHFS